MPNYSNCKRQGIGRALFVQTAFYPFFLIAALEAAILNTGGRHR